MSEVGCIGLPDLTESETAEQEALVSAVSRLFEFFGEEDE